MVRLNASVPDAEVVKLANTLVLETSAFGLVGSTPTFGTYGLLEEFGCPRHPVKMEITGSNPVWTAF